MSRVRSLPLPCPRLAYALLLAMAGELPAERHLMLANRSDAPLCVEGTTLRGRLEAGTWQEPSGGRPRPDLGCRYLVAPGERIEFLRTNWNVGIPDGSSSWFSTRVRAPDGTRIELAHKLDGETLGSHLWRRVGASPWVDDDRTRTYAWVGGEGATPVEVGVAGRTVEYRFGPVLPDTPERDRGSIRVLAWNAARLPIGGTGVEARAAHMARVLTGYDVLVLSELFADEARERLVRDLVAEYPWQTTVLEDDDPLAQDGGVVIASRWPILHQAEHFYQGGVGTDALSAKGAMVAAIRGPRGTFHVVGTHTQSDADGLADSVIDGISFPIPLGRPSPRTVRARQFASLAGFLEGLRIPADEPVIVAGDLNVARASRDEFEAMLETLSVVEPSGDRESATWDPGNELVPDGDRPSRLDYVLVSTRHRGIDPAASRLSVVRPSTPTPWGEGRRDLSDHAAVMADLRLRTEEPKVTLRLAPGPGKGWGYGLLGMGDE